MNVIKDGIYYLIFIFVLFFLIIVLPTWMLVIVGLLMLLITFIIFHEPEITVNPIQKIMLSPVNGKIYKIIAEEVDGKKYTVISLELSLFRSHINKIPLDGKVISKKSYIDLKSFKFIKSHIVVESTFGTYRMEYTAKGLFKKLIFSPEVDDTVYTGTTSGYSLLSSRLDIYIPDNFEILVNINDSLNAGENVIARVIDI